MTSNEVLTQFQNCRLIRNHQLIIEDLWIRNGKIINPEKVFFDEKRAADIKYDCKGCIIAPGFIELQINGGYGVDFSHDVDTVEIGIETVAKGLLSTGVTSFCPTIVTSPKETYHRILPKIKKKQGGKHGATILGIHLEGPFINPNKKGAHPENFILDFDHGFNEILETYGYLENTKIITLAPEKKNSEILIKALIKKDITVALGHSMANLSEGEKAVEAGATLITHLFNAMLPFHHRDPGLVGLLASDKILNEPPIYFGIIADGVHTHPSAVRIAHRTNPNGLIVVTDAISAMGLEEGIHHIGQLDLEVRNGKAYIAGTSTLCGSIATMDECVRILQKFTGCSLVYALETASLHPAKCLKIDDKKGTLNYGSDGDFIFLNDNLEILSTWIAGECVFISKQKDNILKQEFEKISKVNS
ncbi:N-acetylglucosamine-6-phosphate deacetylase [Condylostylus longicornis]|uniref:N-acetylglucosamine-6-phosphate deacetylase n=1 Tax=Condylostylus longicornis TaxID=2530218 RepID=UPI00244DC503|nr:N-acetylglucosamine-6-phosphate deacetylase [Condylostylus longicornis]